MNRAIILFLLFLSAFSTSAQRVQHIAQLSIDSGITEVETLMKNKIADHVELVGIGDIATWVKETQRFNTALSAFLISKKNFKNIFLPVDEWQIRPLNSYLLSTSPLDTVVVDSLLQNYLSDPTAYATVQFRSFIFWLKEHNLSHPGNLVNLFGIYTTETIPHSYFLAAYIYPIDKSSGAKLAKKWDDFVFNPTDAYKDIEEWCLQMKHSNLPKDKRALVERCEMDIAHNKARLIVESMEQKFSAEVVSKYNNYVAGRILERSSEKSILFAANSTVAKSDFLSSSFIDNSAVHTIGKLLQMQLKTGYYVCVAAAGGTIRIPQADLATQSIKIDTLSGSDQVKNMLLSKDTYFTSTDKEALQKFIPNEIRFIKGRTTTLILTEATAPADAVFIFSSLTEDLPFMMK